MKTLSSINTKISPFGRAAFRRCTAPGAPPVSGNWENAYFRKGNPDGSGFPSAHLLPNLEILALRLTIGIALLIAICGCNSDAAIKPEQAIAPILALGSGAAGYLASKDQDEDERALITGAAALGGLAVGSFIADDVAEAKRKEFRDGYNLARSNDIKRLYWRQQAQHRAKPDEPRLKYYAFPGRESGDGGEKLMKHDVVMPVME